MRTSSFHNSGTPARQRMAARAAEWLRRLVQIPSVTPLQVGERAGPPGEAQMAARLAEWFAQLGGTVVVEEVLPARPNVYGIWRGRSDRWMGLDVHTDTVGVEQMTGDPFDGRLENGRVHGRGAVDTKATLAVVLAMLEWMQQQPATPAHNLLLAATADEEDTARGAPASAAWLRRRGVIIDQMIVAEPTQCQPVHGHKGVLRMMFEFQGQACHSSQPHLGRNAVLAAARVALAMEQEHQRLIGAPPGSTLGTATLTVTLLQGGRGLNIVPDRCELAIDRRIVNTEKASLVREQLSELARQVSPVPFAVRVIHEIDAFFQPPNTPWLGALAEWSGQSPTIAPYCTNAWAYAGTVRECVVLGPGSIDQAHGAVEWVEIAELEKLAAIYAKWWGIEA